ncbi:MAG: hypothetical protein IJL25_10320 [Clostridia bacterium]|nr:hypothetical protein [Clostridia bacterium]
MIGWIIKMLLKVMKPFVKMALMEAIFDALEDYALDDTTEEGTTAPEPVTGEDVTLGA